MSDFSTVNPVKLASLGVAVAVLAGCAAPIKSRADLGGASTTVEGIQYFLAKSKVSVTVAVRLDDCDDKSTRARPRVTLLAATSKSIPVADTSAAFNISPKDAWNLFRSIDTAEISLTEDRRIASFSAGVTDKTVEVLTALVKAGAGFRPLGAPSIAEDSVIGCTREALDLISKRDEAMKAIGALAKSRDTLLQTTTIGRGFAETLTAVDGAIEKQRVVIDAAKARLTKSVELSLTPSAGETKKSDQQTIDVNAGWFDSRGTDTILFVASIEREDGLVDAGTASLDTAGTAGIFYRIPRAGVPVTLSATRESGKMTQLTVAVDGGSPLEQATPKVPPKLDVGTPLTLGVSPVKIAQWGRLAIMPSDVGLLTSNSVKSSFDEWGVPKSASWTATPVNIAGLLGLASQADALLNKNAPAADPAAQAKAELLLRLLTICKDADPTAVPAFCAGLTK